jgi:RNA polymerase sigma factor (sigma-70 family)
MSSEFLPEGLPVSRRKSVNAAVRTDDELEEVYRAHYTLLLYISCRKFRVPPGDAESLIQEVFLSYLSTMTEVRDIRSWLVGAISNASRGYWRSRGRTESLPDEINERSDPFSTGFAETVANRITIRETLSRLHERCRETLRLHYFEGCSAPEVARELSTTNRFAEKLIHKCLKRAHKIYLTLTAGRP